MKVRTLLAKILTALIITSCGVKTERTLFPEDLILEPGDIVLRCGSGITSRAVLFADGGGSYSHVGIVADSAGVMMIVHAVPDEHNNSSDVDRVKMDTPEDFFSNIRTSNGRIMRYQDCETAAKAATEAYMIYKRGTLFDHDYDDRDTTKMYCCELVEYAYQKVGMTVVDTMRHDINLPVFSFDHVILPSDFVNSKYLRTIITF